MRRHWEQLSSVLVQSTVFVYSSRQKRKEAEVLFMTIPRFVPEIRAMRSLTRGNDSLHSLRLFQDMFAFSGGCGILIRNEHFCLENGQIPGINRLHSLDMDG